MVFHGFCAAETETFVRTTDSYHVLVVFEQVRIFLLIFPRNSIDRIGALVTVINALLGAIEFFAAIKEGHTLRNENRCLREFIHVQLRFFGLFRSRDGYTIAEAVVVMAGDVGDVLHGFATPPERLRTQQAIRVLKTYTSDQTIHEGLLAGRITGGEAAFMVER